MIILGLESSCDETAASIVENGRTVLSSAVSSQIKIHNYYGGIVPELASRNHIKAILHIIRESLFKSDLAIKKIDGISVTQGPGLVGSLLVGFSLAKAFALSLGIPCVGIDHLTGHIGSIFLSDKTPKFPFIAMLISGGHTNIYYVKSYFSYELIGCTRDDAVGEAYDKVSKMLGFGYPGGNIIENFSKKIKVPKIRFKKPFLNKKNFDFSFSGIKSAVHRYIKKSYKLSYLKKIDIAASFQKTVIEVLSIKIIEAAITRKSKTIVLVGGVAANNELRKKIKEEALKRNFSIYIPKTSLCGDNAAMIASVGYYYIKNKKKLFIEEDVYSKGNL